MRRGVPHTCNVGIHLDEPCWLWLGRTMTGGYGLAKDLTAAEGWARKRSQPVHRAVFRQHYPGWLRSKHEHLHHLCRNKLCYNPAHLQVLGRVAHLYVEMLTHPSPAARRWFRGKLLRVRGRQMRIPPPAAPSLSPQPSASPRGGGLRFGGMY